MKRERFPHPTLYIESFRDWNGRHYICRIKDTTVIRSSRKDVLAFVRWPAKTPTGDALRAWLTALEERDSARASEAPVEGISDELAATGFGPEVHGVDEADPQFQTRTIT